MQSGKIKKSQLSSYASASQDALTKARLFGPNGWRPDDAYMASATTVTYIVPSLPAVMTMPIFFEVRFQRRQKISYFAIQDASLARYSYTQAFYIAFNDGSSKVYGGSIAQVFPCFL